MHSVDYPPEQRRHWAIELARDARISRTLALDAREVEGEGDPFLGVENPQSKAERLERQADTMDYVADVLYPGALEFV